MRLQRSSAAWLVVAGLVLAGCSQTPVADPETEVTASSAGGPEAEDLASPSAGTASGPDSAEPTEQEPDRGSWEPVPPVPLEDAEGWSTVGGTWTGGEFVLLLTHDFGRSGIVQAWGLDPANRSWTRHADLDARVTPFSGEVVWTGRLLLLVSSPPFDDEPDRDLRLHVWDPDGDLWWQATTPPLGERFGHSVSWTGDHLVVFGGLVDEEVDGEPRYRTLADGAAWEPEQDGWFALGPFPHEGRSAHGAVWNGRRLVAFGGGHASGRFLAEGEWPWDRAATGAAAWNPADNTWTSIADPGADGPLVAATWTGERIVWWDGQVEGMSFGDHSGAGGVWDTLTGGVEALPLPPLDLHRDDAAAVWAPELGAWLTWGGACGEGCNQHADDGARWDAAANRWTALPPSGLGRRHAPIAWTGQELLVVGGAIADQVEQDFRDVFDGASWRP